MAENKKALDVINSRIYKELDLIEQETNKPCQLGAVIDRSVGIAVEMNLLRKALENKDSEISSLKFSTEAAEDRTQYLEERLQEEKQKMKFFFEKESKNKEKESEDNLDT